MVLHYSFSQKHIFTQVSADHPLFLLLGDIAARADMPIDVHMEAAPQDQPTPQQLIRRSRRNPEITRATIPGFERLDNRIHDDRWRPKPEWVALMREFPDRFMVGADEFIHVPGTPRRVGPPGGFGKTWSVIRNLPPDLRPKLARHNAVRVYRLAN